MRCFMTYDGFVLLIRDIENLRSCLLDEISDKYSISDKDELQYALFLLNEDVSSAVFNLQRTYDRCKEIYQNEVET